MYFVGIDISKFKHDCAIIDELGDVITSSWSFNNDCEGFSLFRDLLNALDGEKKIGFESTGHYGHNLKLFLEANNFSFMEFNPLLISRYVRSKSLRNTKSDSLDAQSIAQYLMTVEYKPYPPSFYHMVKFSQLKTLARNTVGKSDDFLLKQMEITIDIENQLDAKIDEITAQIAECIRGLNPPILTIPGIGELTAAVILSEYGDIKKYENPAQMLSFAGLEPGYYQSGLTEHGGHMVKHGSSHLRYALMNACLPLITYEPVFAEYYAKKRAEGKPHRVALTHVAKKLLRVIYTLQTKNVPYDPALIR